mmetsp:Transcript_5062/g.12242  ORF Transcript_5062/g.12242 Transcript_5062/m.12242 type:complete len:103 (-) Transcript_5062:564-872(-)
MWESSPVVGSSRNKILGEVSKAMAMLTRFACPPEIPRESSLPITVSLQTSKASFDITLSTIISISSGFVDEGSLSEAVYIRNCLTVKSGTKVSNCSTYEVNF